MTSLGRGIMTAVEMSLADVKRGQLIVKLIYRVVPA